MFGEQKDTAGIPVKSRDTAVDIVDSLLPEIIAHGIRQSVVIIAL